ncbi:sigma 54-interacting transcriptional regulator [Larkinella sp. C7]|uniref:sigma 54-interacting transcriptional regulator n=1 Tax=Larkinella sp. C7 TaxID=2576607 RepID=UPI00111139C3|nr:sigma 54-interacting transcriptional regulator [Larkinella sp. C7]
MKILISWYALQHDFRDGAISDDSPTMQFHQNFFHHDRHLILSSAVAEDTRLDILLNRLAHDFPDRREIIQGRYMDISNNDVINPAAIRPKIEALLQEFSDHDIDLFISPGTPAMQVVWYFCHASLGLRTKLLQTRPPKFNKGIPKLVYTDLELWPEPVAAIIKEKLQGQQGVTSDYLITPSLKPVYLRADKVAEADRVTCLIQGASGTGKEHLARYIHQQSSRSNRPFIAINCSALGNELLESRLFGYVKGAFTGAANDRKGLFEEAHGGTIFLDEIGDISPYMQQSLLRVVQEGEFMPVGSTSLKKVDFRLISATHRDLRSLCARDLFRWDLFYRLSTTEIKLPTVTERGITEKRDLINFFLKSKFKEFRRKKPISITTEAWHFLETYLFPGNVRELENLIESLYVFAGEKVQVADLPEWVREPKEASNSYNWRFHEKLLIQRALKAFNGNKNKTYQALGFGSINTLQKKLAEYNLLPYD